MIAHPEIFCKNCPRAVWYPMGDYEPEGYYCRGPKEIDPVNGVYVYPDEPAKYVKEGWVYAKWKCDPYLPASEYSNPTPPKTQTSFWEMIFNPTRY